MYSVQAGSQSDPVASNYRLTHSPIHARTYSPTISLFPSYLLYLSLAFSRRHVQPDAAVALLTTTLLLLYRSTG